MPVDTHEDIMPAAGIEGPNVVETHEDIQPAMGVTAYHGSPHEFEQFDTSKIGTGEGVQAYGHGLYFAENENVAKDYRDRLTDKASSFRVENIDMPKWILRKIESHPDRAQAISEIRNDFQNRLVEAEEEAKGSHQPWMASGKISTAKDVLAGLDKIETGANIPHTRGRMYEVNLDVGPEHLLDWDKPLSEQPAFQAVRKHWDDKFGDPDIIAQRLGLHDQSTGRDLYESFSGNQRNQEAASNKLSEMGLRGIRYLDAGSRGKDGESGSHNYVIFDPQHIKVKRRYAEGGEVPDRDDEGVIAYAFGNSVPHIEQRIAGGEFPEATDENQRVVEHDLLRPIGQSKMIGDEDLLFNEGMHSAGIASNAMNNKRSIRYLHHDAEGAPIGALQIMTHGPRSKKATIQNIYVAQDSRRQKIATGLLKRARQDYDVRHSGDLTTQGKAFAKATKAYGGAIAGPKLTEENAEDFARRLILWSYAAAPFVNRSIRRATGGEVDPSVDQALDAARGASQADPAVSAMETARSLTPMGFYSAAAEAASKIPQRAPIDQILNKVKGAPGVKAEELDWSGVKDAFAGQRSVDPQEVARHFQASLPALQETVKEDPDTVANRMAQKLAREPDQKKAYEIMDQMKAVYDPSWRKEHGTIYNGYTLPGGANYREVLLHLPNEEREKGYKSSHWNVPNVVAHLRLSDRDMGKTLHMEELQSDWGQEGRDQGFGGRDTTGWRAEPTGEPGGGMYVFDQNNRQIGYAPVTHSETERDAINHVASFIKGPPKGPHVTSNEGWTDLGLKRALQEAAKGGYKELIWTPGQEQADRYDLSSQVKHIMWSPDNKILSALTHDNSEAIGQRVEKEDLHKYIGKEAAKKLLEQKPEMDGNMATHHLRGQAISVGGEGMKNYYDRFLPGRLQKLVSKLDPEAKVQLHGHRMFVPDEREGDSEEGEYKNVHSLKITPKLRAAVLKGLPAYKQGGFATNSAPIVNKALEVVSGLRR